MRQAQRVRVWSTADCDGFARHHFWPHQDGEFIHSFLTQSFLEQLLCARYSSPGLAVSKTEKVSSSWSLHSGEEAGTVKHVNKQYNFS